MSDDHAQSEVSDGLPPKSELATIRLASGHSDGGHELDALPNGKLMGFITVMAIILVVISVGVYQLFATHTQGQLSDAAAIPSSQLAAQVAKDKLLETTYGKVEVANELVAYRVPFAVAKQLVLTTPARFEAAAKPAGWVHPDDAAKK